MSARGEAPGQSGQGKPPRVSVLMLTYNHGAFVAQAIESALAQVTPFPWELVIGDDSSTDGTAAVIAAYAERHPALIRAVLRPSNIGARRNFLDCYGRCRGELVALLEGDDYWLSPGKLAAQVEALDRAPEAMLATHEGFNEYPDGSRQLYVRDAFGRTPGARLELRDVVFNNFLPTCSFVFRRAALATFPDGVLVWPLLDWFIVVLLALKGPVLFHDEPWGVRRVHPGGVISMKPLSHKLETILTCIEIADGLTAHRFPAERRARRAECHRRLFEELLREGRPWPAMRHALAAVRLGARPAPGGVLRAVARLAAAGVAKLGGRARRGETAVTDGRSSGR